jgi:hypothetical protein
MHVGNAMPLCLSSKTRTDAMPCGHVYLRPDHDAQRCCTEKFYSTLDVYKATIAPKLPALIAHHPCKRFMARFAKSEDIKRRSNRSKGFPEPSKSQKWLEPMQRT